ncbi:MAG TPA: hypothetical protein P5117_16080, partial [Spirochaetia bacterium]|nr:hypothetical protein [Spirochaetia bacterium]
MKRRVSRSICLAILLVSLLSAGGVFAQEKPVNLESKVIDSFDDPEGNPWFVMGSKFSTAEFPKVASVNSWPISIYGYNPADKD